MQALWAGLRILYWGFAGPPQLLGTAGQTPLSRVAACLWSMLIGSLVMVAILLALFPFFKSNGPVWASPLILLVSLATTLALLSLAQLLSRKLRFDVTMMIALAAPVLLLQAVSVAGVVLCLYFFDAQEGALAGMASVMLFSSLWQGALMYAGMVQLLGIRSFLAAICSGAICLVSFLAGILLWLSEFAAAHLEWNSGFFI